MLSNQFHVSISHRSKNLALWVAVSVTYLHHVQCDVQGSMNKKFTPMNNHGFLHDYPH